MIVARPAKRKPVVSIIPLIDVLLILLIFFLVTSTFLELEMLPMAEDAPENPAFDAGQASPVLLMRIRPTGDVVAAGEILAHEELVAYLQRISDQAPRLRLLPSPQADVQALVSVLDAAALAGLTDVQVIQIEGRQ